MRPASIIKYDGLLQDLKGKAAEELRKVLAISSGFPGTGKARRMLAKLGPPDGPNPKQLGSILRE